MKFKERVTSHYFRYGNVTIILGLQLPLMLVIPAPILLSLSRHFIFLQMLAESLDSVLHINFISLRLIIDVVLELLQMALLVSVELVQRLGLDLL